MQIVIKSRNTSVSDDLRERVEKRFAKIERQVSPLAELEIEISQQRNPAIPAAYTVEATLHLKGVTLRACDSAPDATRAVNLASDELTRQVKRHRDKRRKRREARSASLRGGVSPAA